MNGSAVCTHIKEAQQSQCTIFTTEYAKINLSRHLLESGPFPPVIRSELTALLKSGQTTLIQRVSKNSFVVVTNTTAETPLGLLHMKVDGSNKIRCTCQQYKREVSLGNALTASKLSKRCFHFYLCLWAILSDEFLKKEFLISEGSTVVHSDTGNKGMMNKA